MIIFVPIDFSGNICPTNISNVNLTVQIDVISMKIAKIFFFLLNNPLNKSKMSIGTQFYIKISEKKIEIRYSQLFLLMFEAFNHNFPLANFCDD